MFDVSWEMLPSASDQIPKFGKTMFTNDLSASHYLYKVEQKAMMGDML